MAQKKGNCYIDVWREANFGGESVRLYGPAEYPDLEFAEGYWGNDIGSLRVGPDAFVMAFRRRGFQDGPVTFGPFDEVADLSDLKFDDDIESVKVIDSLKIFERVGYNEAPAPPAEADARHDPQKGKNRKGGRR
jgi:hypothetical protein